MAESEDILDNENLHEILFMVSQNVHQPDKNQYLFNRIKDLINLEGSSKESYASQLLKRISTNNFVDINQPDEAGNTPLHFACMANNTDSIAFLLSDKRLTTLNSKNVSGETPLMAAVNRGQERSVEMMIEAKGVDLLTRNKSGETLVEVARRRKFGGFIDLLRAKEWSIIFEVANHVEGNERKPKSEAKKSRHRKKTKSKRSSIQDESVKTEPQPETETEPEEQKMQPKEDFSWLGDHCHNLDQNVLRKLEPSEKEEMGIDPKEKYEELRNILELKQKESECHYNSVDAMAKEKAREMKDLIYSIEDITKSEVKRGKQKLEIKEQMRQLETELNAIQNKDTEEKEAKDKLDKKKNKLEEFMDTFRKEAKETAAVFQTEIKTLKESLDNFQINLSDEKSEGKIHVDNPEHLLLKFIESEIEDLEKELECPVCFNLATSPIFKCDDDHLICSSCKVKLMSCPQCREDYPKEGARRFRGAERQAEKLEICKAKKNKITISR